MVLKIHISRHLCYIEGPAPGLELEKACSYKNKDLAKWMHKTSNPYEDEALAWYAGLGKEAQEKIHKAARVRDEGLDTVIRKMFDLVKGTDKAEVAIKKARKEQASIESRVRFYDLANQTFPYGLLGTVVEVLEREQIDYTVVQDVAQPTRKLAQKVELSGALRDYQEEGLQELEERHGAFSLPTGSGKSVVAAGLIAKHNARTLVLVRRKNDLYQMRSFLAEWLLVDGKSPSIGLLGDGNEVIQPITVAVVNSAANKIHLLLDQFDQLICDEHHHSATKTYLQVIRPLAPYWSYGLSGTAFRSKKSEQIALKASFGEVLVDLSVESLREKGYLSQLKLELLRNNEEANNKLAWGMLYHEAIVHSQHRNSLIAQRVAEAVEAGQTVLVATDQVTHGRNLVQAIRNAGVLSVAEAYGSDDAQERQELLKRLRDKHLSVLVGTIFDESVDIPTLDVFVNAAGRKPAVTTQQRAGRASRATKQKHEALVIDIWDEGHPTLLQHSRERLRHYQNASVKIPEEFLEELEDREEKALKGYQGSKILSEEDLNFAVRVGESAREKGADNSEEKEEW